MPGLATLVEVIDGDTIVVTIDGSQHTVDYLGIDAPELDQPYGEDARQFNAARLGDNPIRLVADTTDKGPDGQLLRWVFAEDGTLMNDLLVGLGLARLKLNDTDVKYKSKLLASEEQAKKMEGGIWKGPQTARPTSAPNSSAPSATGRHISGDGVFGCTDRSYLNQLGGYLADGDSEAFQEAWLAYRLAGVCTMFTNGEEVYVEDTGFFAGLLKVRRKGQPQEFWTFWEAVK
jgi:endonuclease YncB( thermonuclease family)